MARQWLVVLLLTAAGLVGGQTFKQTEQYAGATFFDGFSFFTGPDPTNGYVYYASEQQAFAWGYVKNSQPVYIGCDSWSVSTGSGRGSVRITSLSNWTATAAQSFVFALDLNHMPSGCGTWPAWWLVGPDWPNCGEIDIVEGVNGQPADQTTLHTDAGCVIPVQPGSMSGSWGVGVNGQPATNCDVNAPDQYSNQGCPVVGGPDSMGAPFNAAQGGVYALQWNTTGIAAWYFARGQIPADLAAGSPFVEPAGWGLPYAFFALSQSTCPPSHFQQLSMVFDLTFCGDWAGNTFGQMCPGLGSCDAYVQNNPAAFQEAYWSINYVKVFSS